MSVGDEDDQAGGAKNLCVALLESLEDGGGQEVGDDGIGSERIKRATDGGRSEERTEGEGEMMTRRRTTLGTILIETSSTLGALNTDIWDSHGEMERESLPFFPLLILTPTEILKYFRYILDVVSSCVEQHGWYRKENTLSSPYTEEF